MAPNISDHEFPGQCCPLRSYLVFWFKKMEAMEHDRAHRVGLLPHDCSGAVV